MLDDVVPPIVLQPQVLVGLDEGLDVAALELRGRDASLWSPIQYEKFWLEF